MRIPAYCSMAYLEDITQRSAIDYIQPENLSSGKEHFDLLELIAEGLVIKTDVSQEKIEEKSVNPYIKYLIKNRRITAEPSTFIQLRTEEDSFFSNSPKGIQLYLLSETSSGKRKEYQSKSGYYFLTPSSNHTILFEEELESFNRGEVKNWVFASRFLMPHHSIVIADPYLFKEATIKEIILFFEQTIPADLKSIYHVSLIGSAERKGMSLSNKIVAESVLKIKNAISKKLPNCIVEYHIYNKEEFHDRYVITNNTCIFSGYGLDILKNGKEGSWVAFKPFKRINLNGKKGILFFGFMKEKLAVLKNWIDKSENLKTTLNPLFKL